MSDKAKDPLERESIRALARMIKQQQPDALEIVLNPEITGIRFPDRENWTPGFIDEVQSFSVGSITRQFLLHIEYEIEEEMGIESFTIDLSDSRLGS